MFRKRFLPKDICKVPEVKVPDISLKAGKIAGTLISGYNLSGSELAETLTLMRRTAKKILNIIDKQGGNAIYVEF